jgi:KAP family P-loop domain
MTQPAERINGARNVALDNPVELPEEDEFNRSPFSWRLAETIAGFDTSQGAPVLGLYGRWGYGKSTVLNFVRVALQRHHGDRVAIFPFNPWLFKDQDALLREFFAGLARTIGTEFGKTGQKIGELMERYGGALSSVPLVGGSLSKIVEAFGKDLAKDPTSAQRKRLTELMLDAPKKVVVLIDDLDRLDRDEIMIMLKMVRLSANFPNVIYLLAFDEERVGRVAGQAYGELADGRPFLEKIIQYPFLPAVGSDRLVAYVIRHARRSCDGAGITLSDKAWSEFRRVCKEILLVRLNTPRQAIRYANALHFALPILKGKVDPFDQMIVEAMRILFPTLYSYVRDHVDFDATKLPPMQGVESEVAEPLIKVLRRWERESAKPVSDPRYHDRYFSYAVAVDDVSDAELEFLVDLSNKDDQLALDSMVRDLAEKRLEKLAERLSSRVDELALAGARHLALAMAKCGDVLPDGGLMRDHRLAPDVGSVVAKLASHLMLFQKDQGNFVAPQVIEHATPLPFASVIYDELGRVELRERETVPEQQRSPPQDWQQIRDALYKRIKNEARAAWTLSSP